MMVWTVEFSCWLIVVRYRVLCCCLSVPLALVTQSGGRKLNYIMVMAIRNLPVEYGHWTVKQTCDSVLNNIVNFINGLRVSLVMTPAMSETLTFNPWLN
jgi:hypothetical protein